MNKGSNLKLRRKSDDNPVIGRSCHITGWQCMCVCYFFLQEAVCIILISNPVIFRRHQIWGRPFFITPCSFNWLSLKMLLLQLVSNDSGFPVYRRQPKANVLCWIYHGRPHPSCPPPTSTCRVDGGPGHTESPPLGCLCLCLLGFPDSWCQPHVIHMKIRNPPFKKEYHGELVWIAQLRGF